MATRTCMGVPTRNVAPSWLSATGPSPPQPAMPARINPISSRMAPAGCLRRRRLLKRPSSAGHVAGAFRGGLRKGLKDKLDFAEKGGPGIFVHVHGPVFLVKQVIDGKRQVNGFQRSPGDRDLFGALQVENQGFLHDQFLAGSVAIRVGIVGILLAQVAAEQADGEIPGPAVGDPQVGHVPRAKEKIVPFQIRILGVVVDSRPVVGIVGTQRPILGEIPGQIQFHAVGFAAADVLVDPHVVRIEPGEDLVVGDGVETDQPGLEVATEPALQAEFKGLGGFGIQVGVGQAWIATGGPVVV
ncbi:hypothetical protein DESC_580081 [Desulfosarcina cetonica]|nr:hypothetical protein DESC_580081 [Desulfosarcina cetonica]